MDINQLAMEIEALKGRNAEMDAQNQFSGFMDKYGQSMSGDEDIGMAVLNEFNRRGIDMGMVSFEAVQSVLDEIRAEAQSVMDKIKMDQRQVADLMDQVATVSEAVAAATGAVPDADMTTGLPPPGTDAIAAGIDNMAAMEPPPLPMEGDMAAMEPEMPPPEQLPMEGDMAAMEPEMPPPEQLPPPPVVSDERMKNVVPKTMSFRPKAKTAMAQPEVPKFKFPGFMIDAARKGVD